MRPSLPLLAALAIAIGAPVLADTSPSESSLSDAELARRIVGYWCYSPDGNTCVGFDHFMDSGIGETCSLLPGRSTVRHASARYWVHDGQLCIKFFSSTDAGDLGESFCATVLRIDDESKTYLNPGVAKPITEQRLHGKPPRCPDGKPL